MHGKFIVRQNVLFLLYFISLKRLNAFHRQAAIIPEVVCVMQGQKNMEVYVVHLYSCPGLVRFHVLGAGNSNC